MRYVRNGGIFGSIRAAALIGAACGGVSLAGAQTVQTIVPPPPPPPIVRSPPPLPFAIPPAPAPVMPILTEAQATQLRQMLASASAHGITLPTKADVGQIANGQDLIRLALNYATALHSGGLAEKDYLKDWGLRPPIYNPWTSFLDAVAKDRLAAWIAALPPPYTGYDGLRRGLATYRAIQSRGGWSTLAAGTDLKPGATGARVAALRKRLAVEDSGVALGGDYDASLVEAVQRAQKRYGLEPTGVVGAQTLAALNVPVAERIHQIVANMERWRWLPAELPIDRVQVNIAAAVLTVFRADSPILSMRAVTGRPGDNTPMLHSRIHSIVFNPPWNVPSSIATKELWPKERKNPGYLAKHGFKVITTPDGGKRLQQRSEQSALGKYKFDFDNPYGVYLHDTPTQATFGRYSRLDSHGCVRLARPAELAKLMLTGDGTWTPDAIDGAIAGGKTVRARLAQPVSVFLLYWTAFAAGSGQISFRADPYDWDETLATRLQAKANPASDIAANN
jgi:murein L,D-transpeptidase YcbB/YkuD